MKRFRLKAEPVTRGQYVLYVKLYLVLRESFDPNEKTPNIVSAFLAG